MKIAVVHDWLDSYRGGEKVLESILNVIPQAKLHTLFLNRAKLPSGLANLPIVVPSTNFFLRRFRKILIGQLPRMVESIDLQDFDLVVSSSSAVAKGIIPSPTARHLCYIHSPMRYIWDQEKIYEESLPRMPFIRSYFRSVCHELRKWDVTSSARVDCFVANSHFVAARVERYYRRSSVVIPPPVDVLTLKALGAKFAKPSRDYFLVAGANVPYKRIDIAIEACQRLKLPIVVAGIGVSNLKSQYSAKLRLVENPDRDEWCKLLFNARALVFPGVEDFGIVPIEAMALGTPVIAFKAGGALDYIDQDVNGHFFMSQNVDSCAEALSQFRSDNFDPIRVSGSVHKFDRSEFEKAFKDQMNQIMEK